MNFSTALALSRALAYTFAYQFTEGTHCLFAVTIGDALMGFWTVAISLTIWI